MKHLFMTMCFAGMVLLCAGCGTSGQSGQEEALAVLNPERDFTLTDQDGNAFHLKDHRGKVVLLFFGYLSCPDICPVTISKLVKVKQILGPGAGEMLTAFVSVDPNRDTPAKLKEYLGYFNLSIVGLTGSKAEIDRVVDSFKAYYHMTAVDSPAGYLVDHTSHIYVIDGQGVVRALAHFEDGADKIASVVKPLL